MMKKLLPFLLLLTFNNLFSQVKFKTLLESRMEQAQPKYSLIIYFKDNEMYNFMEKIEKNSIFQNIFEYHNVVLIHSKKLSLNEKEHNNINYYPTFIFQNRYRAELFKIEGKITENYLFQILKEYLSTEKIEEKINSVKQNNNDIQIEYSIEETNIINNKLYYLQFYALSKKNKVRETIKIIKEKIQTINSPYNNLNVFNNNVNNINYIISENLFKYEAEDLYNLFKQYNLKCIIKKHLIEL